MKHLIFSIMIMCSLGAQDVVLKLSDGQMPISAKKYGFLIESSSIIAHLKQIKTNQKPETVPLPNIDGNDICLALAYAAYCSVLKHNDLKKIKHKKKALYQMLKDNRLNNVRLLHISSYLDFKEPPFKAISWWQKKFIKSRLGDFGISPTSLVNQDTLSIVADGMYDQLAYQLSSLPDAEDINFLSNRNDNFIQTTSVARRTISSCKQYWAEYDLNNIHIYNRGSHNLIERIQINNFISSIAFIPNTTILIIGLNSGHLYTWNFNSTAMEYGFAFAAPITQIIANEYSFVCYSDWGKIRLYHINQQPVSSATTSTLWSIDLKEKVTELLIKDQSVYCGTKNGTILVVNENGSHFIGKHTKEKKVDWLICNNDMLMSVAGKEAKIFIAHEFDRIHLVNQHRFCSKYRLANHIKKNDLTKSIITNKCTRRLLTCSLKENNQIYLQAFDGLDQIGTHFVDYNPYDKTLLEKKYENQLPYYSLIDLSDRQKNEELHSIKRLLRSLTPQQLNLVYHLCKSENNYFSHYHATYEQLPVEVQTLVHEQANIPIAYIISPTLYKKITQTVGIVKVFFSKTIPSLPLDTLI